MSYHEFDYGGSFFPNDAPLFFGQMMIFGLVLIPIILSVVSGVLLNLGLTNPPTIAGWSYGWLMLLLYPIIFADYYLKRSQWRVCEQCDKISTLYPAYIVTHRGSRKHLIWREFIEV